MNAFPFVVTITVGCWIAFPHPGVLIVLNFLFKTGSVRIRTFSVCHYRYWPYLHSVLSCFALSCSDLACFKRLRGRVIITSQFIRYTLIFLTGEASVLVCTCVVSFSAYMRAHVSGSNNGRPGTQICLRCIFLNRLGALDERSQKLHSRSFTFPWLYWHFPFWKFPWQLISMTQAFADLAYHINSLHNDHLCSEIKTACNGGCIFCWRELWSRCGSVH